MKMTDSELYEKCAKIVEKYMGKLNSVSGVYVGREAIFVVKKGGDIGIEAGSAPMPSELGDARCIDDEVKISAFVSMKNKTVKIYELC